MRISRELLTQGSLFMIPGYSSRLSTIQWRTIEDYIVLGYEDETAMVWQVKQELHVDSMCISILHRWQLVI